MQVFGALLLYWYLATEDSLITSFQTLSDVGSSLVSKEKSSQLCISILCIYQIGSSAKYKADVWTRHRELNDLLAQEYTGRKLLSKVYE